MKRFKRIVRSTAAGGILASGSWLAGCSTGGLTKAKPTVSAPAYSLVWSDEFDEPKLDRTKWTPERSCWGGGNNEKQCYTDRPENFKVKDGILTLIARPEIFEGHEFSQEKPDRGRMISRNYTSAKLRTLGLAQWKYGRFEARIKLPQGQSTWPAFWMLPSDNVYGPWPTSGEIDIMEAINLAAECDDCESSEVENRTMGSLHFGPSWPHNKFITKKRSMPASLEGFNVYAIEWQAGTIKWLVNGQEFFRLTAQDWSTSDTGSEASDFAPFDQLFYLNLNLAVGGTFPDEHNEARFNPASFPAQMQIDWVRVFKSTDKN